MFGKWGDYLHSPSRENLVIYSNLFYKLHKQNINAYLGFFQTLIVNLHFSVLVFCGTKTSFRTSLQNFPRKICKTEIGNNDKVLCSVVCVTNGITLTAEKLALTNIIKCLYDPLSLLSNLHERNAIY